MVVLQAIQWIVELCDVLTKSQQAAVQPDADVDALNAEQEKFENTAQVRTTVPGEIAILNSSTTWCSKIFVR